MNTLYRRLAWLERPFEAKSIRQMTDEQLLRIVQSGVEIKPLHKWHGTPVNCIPDVAFEATVFHFAVR